MRTFSYLALGLFMSAVVNAATPNKRPLYLRQDGGFSSTDSPASTSIAIRPSSTTFSSQPYDDSAPEPPETKRPRQSIIDKPATTAAQRTVNQATQSDASAFQPLSTNVIEESKRLPIQPKITPALGIAGAVLLISGAIYTIIGIRSRWLYIFLTAAYLGSLAVTVLIVYLMTPPVSDAAQGGFFVAALLSGVLLGGVALVFTDLVDGFGCLLGGFCLSMWFVTLKEDGLIESTTGRAILIGCFCAAVFSLSFSHYTRDYALMGSIAFSGSTITMLGIDCFSRAGWKEFWLYLWDLSPRSFPIGTDTYPLTRGIKVEIAGVILFAVFGLISQLKLWKIVEKRRAKSAEARQERDRYLEREEEEAGRRVTTILFQERAQWEAAYGGDMRARDSKVDSTTESARKSSIFVQEKDACSADSVAMESVSPKRPALQPSRSPNCTGGMREVPSVIVTSRPEGSSRQASDALQQCRPISHQNGTKPPTLCSGSEYHCSESVISAEPATHTMTSSEDISPLTPSPEVIPLPFKVPHHVESDGSEGTSVSAVAEPSFEPPPVRKLASVSSKRTSRASIRNPHSSIDSSQDGQEDGVTHVDDDRATSVAATLNDDYDRLTAEDSSPTPQVVPSSPRPSNLEGTNTCSTAHVPKASADQASPISGEAWGERDATEGFEQLGREDHLTKPSTVTDCVEQAYVPPSPPPSSPVKLSQDVLPSRLSKVALSYRTNEWAKHLEMAEQPQLEQLPESESPGVKLVHDPMELVASRNHTEVDTGGVVDATQSHTATSGAPIRGSKLPHSTPEMARQLNDPNEKPPTLPSQAGVQTKGMHSPSTPYPGQLLGATISRASNTPSAEASSTLLGKRESLMRNRLASTQSLTPLGSSSTLLSALEQENMTLAQRRQLIQQQKASPLPQQKRQSGRELPDHIQGLDFSQSKRVSAGMNANRRETILAGWRESIRQDGATATRKTTKEEESRRTALMQEKRQMEMQREEKALRAQQRESLLESRMRSGEMLDAHREAMRRLQAKANRHVS
ncbi:hypothetical protein M011DRAFT_474863 [Sporormia fimetaria CBS 119925]|uniref:TM7S3/TM198-like domain-containing protein n=1 Tax=Sporormia fimetaria CBS 119925 TaxID=1340428 RepID=A0A6A6VKU4_9PLEO|nr:hypothetical protein M011DRAFT_474863 [Sporormia fimetaria CBS 119925]